jgi:hypothetical protein
MPLPFVSDDDTLDIFSALQAAMAKGRAEIKLRRGDRNDIVRLTETELRRTKRIAILLFRRSDPDAVTPIYEHSKTRKFAPGRQER